MIALRAAALRRLALLTAGAAALLALAVAGGCGGGVGVGGTGAFASGPITGFGSVFVGGVEFDDSKATVVDTDGAVSGRGALRLGMYAEVESSAIGGSVEAPTAIAARIRYASEIVGPAGNLQAAALTVLGQPVTVTGATVFDEALPLGLASVTAGQVLEVYGLPSAVGTGFVATRIEPRSGNAPFFRVHGTVARLDAQARTFSMGGLDLSYTDAPPGLADGADLRVRIATAPVAGRWPVLGFGSGRPSLPDIDRARLSGTVTAFASSRAFSVNGQPVDASAAAFPDGEAGVVLGARVQVEGAAAAGVLRATTVRLDEPGKAQGDFELKGSIESVQPQPQTFRLRGVTVFYGGAVDFKDGTAADIAAGVEVEVRGVLSGGGTRLNATAIRIRR